jgi:hypothetical protein
MAIRRISARYHLAREYSVSEILIVRRNYKEIRVIYTGYNGEGSPLNPEWSSSRDSLDA